MASLSISVGSSTETSPELRMTHMWQRLILTDLRSALFSGDPWKKATTMRKCQAETSGYVRWFGEYNVYVR